MSKLKSYIDAKEKDTFDSMINNDDDIQNIINKTIIVLLNEIREICEKRGRY